MFPSRQVVAASEGEHCRCYPITVAALIAAQEAPVAKRGPYTKKAA
jgi:hypothetical protein